MSLMPPYRSLIFLTLLFQVPHFRFQISRESAVTELYDRPNRPETLEVEPEEEVDTDEKSPYILQSEVEKLLRK